MWPSAVGHVFGSAVKGPKIGAPVSERMLGSAGLVPLQRKETVWEVGGPVAVQGQ